MADLALILALVLPLFGIVSSYALAKQPNLREAATLLIAVLLFADVLYLAQLVFGGMRPTLPLAEPIPGFGLSLGLEPLGMLFALIASGLWIVNSLYSIGYMRGNKEKDQTRFYAFFALAISATMGVALSGTLLTLFVFYEILTVSTFPLVTHKGSEEAKQAGRMYLGILMGSSIALFLLAMIWTAFSAGTLEFRDGGILAAAGVPPVIGGVLLVLFVYGIGKAALMPLHRWLPAAMVAPTPVSALLHAVAVVKAGVFSVVKVVVFTFGLDYLGTLPSTEFMAMIAGASILIASSIALRQDNLKRRLAYSTISQLSYVTLGALLIAPLSVIGAILHIAAHAVGKITLFFAAGSIYTAAHKTEVSQLNGIGKRMPWTMTAFGIGAASMIGLPPTAGFLSKWFILQGAWSSEQYWAAAVLVVSTLLNAGYFVPILHRAFLRPLSAEDRAHPHGEAPLPIVLAICVTASLTLLLFFLPGPVLELARQAVMVQP